MAQFTSVTPHKEGRPAVTEYIPYQFTEVDEKANVETLTEDIKSRYWKDEP